MRVTDSIIITRLCNFIQLNARNYLDNTQNNNNNNNIVQNVYFVSSYIFFHE